jgi:hypothetical protein
VNRERLPLAASLAVLGLGAAVTGVQFEEGLYLTVAGAAVVGIGILTLLSKGSPRAVRYFDAGPPVMPRMPEGVEAKVAWSGQGEAPPDLRNALDRMGVTLESAPEQIADTGTRIFTAHLTAEGIKTNDDDLRARGVEGTALLESVKVLGMELADRTLIEVVMTVSVPGRRRYAVKNLSMAPTDQLIAIGRNLSVPVLVDPEDETRLMVDWDRG